MPRQFSINLNITVAEGILDGLLQVGRGGWPGLVVVCPRPRYEGVRARPVFEGGGVYLLIGSQGDADRPRLHINHAQSVRDSLDTHLAEDDFWQRAIFFTKHSGSLNDAESRHLAAQLWELASSAQRYEVANPQRPSRPRHSGTARTSIDRYLEKLLPVLPFLGVDAFVTPQQASGPQNLREPQNEATRYYSSGRGWTAEGYEVGRGFLVCRGSIARERAAPSLRGLNRRKRQQLVDDGVLMPTDNGFAFAVDHIFDSASQAASVCSGTPSGLRGWRDSRGVSLRDSQPPDVAVPRGVQTPPTPREAVEPSGTPATYHFRNRNGEWDALGRAADGRRFTVLAESFARRETVPSMGDGARQIRERLINDGILTEEGGRYRFTANYTFQSSSLAAEVCAGSKRSGLAVWKDTRDDTPLGGR